MLLVRRVIVHLPRNNVQRLVATILTFYDAFITVVESSQTFSRGTLMPGSGKSFAIAVFRLPVWRTE
jgi:hypothetical protein